MTKAEAWYILSERIKNLCISDLVYEDSPCVYMLIAALSEIDSCANTLNEAMERAY